MKNWTKTAIYNFVKNIEYGEDSDRFFNIGTWICMTLVGLGIITLAIYHIWFV